MENLLYILPLLACPLMMGVMMWMMRGNHNQATGSNETPSGNLAPNVEPEDRLAVLHAQLADMERQQAALTGQIARLQAEDGAPMPLDQVEADPIGSRPLPARRSA